MRLSTTAELAGFFCLTVFTGLMYRPAAWAAAGVALLFIGYATEDQQAALALGRIVDPLVRKVRSHRAKRAGKKAAKAK